MLKRIRKWALGITPAVLLFSLAPAALGAPPVVKTVPWVANDPAKPHDTWSGKTIHLKGTADVQGSNIQYSWDFGDGSPAATGIVTSQYAIEADHAYTGITGTVFTAKLTVTNTSTTESGSQVYYVELRDKTLQTEVNVAIDEGLWAIHKQQTRTTSSGVPIGYWPQVGYSGLYAASVTAFEVNGHLPNGDSSNPYVETVQRGLAALFLRISTRGIGMSPAGNPDSNGNGLGVFVSEGYSYYQGGMFIDALVASGTPDAIAPLGSTGILGRTYKDIVQDMVDDHAYCEYYSTAYGGGWRYNCGEFPDNSVSQWAAIGLIAAERNFGAIVPQWVKDLNVTWLAYSQNAATGQFGYTDPSPIWGPYATTPSGMVQMVMDGIGRGQTGPPPSNRPVWNLAESFMRDHWDDPGTSYGNNVKNYYYGLFSFTKSMLLSQPPIKMLHSSNPAKPDIDWYAAEVSKGDTSDGVARTLVNAQLADGIWWGHDATGQQYYFETAWAVIMLNRTIFEAVPVAVVKVTPNPSLANQTITLDGSGSYHQDSSKHIVSWQWDLNNDGVYEKTGPVVTTSYPALGSYTVTLMVVDDSTPQPKSATAPATVNVTVPPVPPTAEAGGPYVFCPGNNWFLDGSRSVNPDNGISEPGYPGDFIKSYAWDLYGNNTFTDAFGATPNVTGSTWAPGDHIVQLKVTDNSGASFPSSPDGDLSSVDSARVTVTPTCTCTTLTARAKSQKVQLTWVLTGADHYNIYRSQVAGGPYQLIGSTTNSTIYYYVDSGLTNGLTYYYVVREAQPNGNERCQSNQVSAKPASLF